MNETLADILDEVRSDEAASVLTTGLLAHEMKQQLNFWADRIEAEAVRERALLDANVNRVRELESMLDGAANTVLGCAIKQKKSAPGNVSAMREALIQCELFLGNVSRHAHPTLNPGDKCIACDGVDELRGMVDAALAAPARNCDRFRTEEEAYTEFGKAGNAFGADTAERLYRYARWLFAPEGGAR